MTVRTRLRGWIWLAAVVALAGLFGAVVLPRLQVETDILALLPEGGIDHAGNAAIDRFSQSLSARMLLLVGGGDIPTAKAAATAYADVLRRSGAFRSVTLEQDAFGRSALSLYEAHRGYLLSHRQQALLENGQQQRLRDDALRAAYTPTGLMRVVSFGDDPLGLANDYFLQQLPASGAAQLDGNVLVIPGEPRSYVMVSAELSGSPFGTTVQEAAEAALDVAQTAAQRAVAPAAVEVVISGAVRHAAAARRRATAEMSFFGGIETVLVAALLIAVFGALRPLALGALTTALAFTAGLCATWLAFGRVHVLTLVFGSSLIGGVIDYSIHVFADRFRGDAQWTAARAVAHVGGAILLGLTTTLLAYAVLLAVPFPGLRQIAAFCIAGLATGCFTVLFAYPTLYRASGRAAVAGPRAGAWLARQFAGWRWTAGRVAIAVLLLIAAGTGLPRIVLQDDVRALQSSPPELLAAEKRVSELMHTGTESRFLLVQGASAQQVLENESTLIQRLERLKSQGALASWLAVSSSVPPLREQQRAHELLQASVTGPGGSLEQLLRQLGYSPADAAARLRPWSGEGRPLLIDEWLASPVSAGMRALWVGGAGGHFASIVSLAGLADLPALRAAVQDAPGVRLVDRVQSVSDILQAYRRELSWMLAVVYAMALAYLALRHGPREALLLVAPSVLASVVTLGLFGWFAVPVNLFTLLALWLVLGLGIDYGIFLRHGRAALPTAVLSVTLSATTTLLAFGLLAFSATPFIRSIGLTLLLAICFSWFFAMLLCLTTGKEDD